MVIRLRSSNIEIENLSDHSHKKMLLTVELRHSQYLNALHKFITIIDFTCRAYKSESTEIMNNLLKIYS